jgi:Family of unknown function (DUF5996)
MDDAVIVWPDLPYASWLETAATLQLWTQIVGKLRLTLTPWLNHGWQVPLYATARGLGTSPIPVGNEILEIEFDFISHRLVARTSRGDTPELPRTASRVSAPGRLLSPKQNSYSLSSVPGSDFPLKYFLKASAKI